MSYVGWPTFLRRVVFTCGRPYIPQREERMYPGYQPKPDDVFHAVGYTTRAVSENTHFRLHGISDRGRVKNENLLGQLAPLEAPIQAAKVKPDVREVICIVRLSAH